MALSPRRSATRPRRWQSAPTKVESTFENPFLAHATMEPMNCTVQVTQDGCDIWVGTQIPAIAQMAVAKTLGSIREQVRIHNHLLGGGFGRRLEFDGIVQAAQIAKQSKDPVKVVWSREEDIQHDMYRPYYYDRISAGLDAHGKLVAWSIASSARRSSRAISRATFKDGIDPDAVEGAIDLPYDIPNFHVEYVREEPPGIPTAFWRGVGPTRNAFVVESFIDELAAAAKKDPFEFRRALTADKPARAACAGARRRDVRMGHAARAAQGRGIALLHALRQLHRAGRRGERRRRRRGAASIASWRVVDCGQVVNPDTVEAQMQSGIIFGLTAALWGEITLEGRPRRADELRRLPDAAHRSRRRRSRSQIVKSSEAPGGIGEPGTSALCRRCSTRFMPRPACGCASCRSRRSSCARPEPCCVAFD